MERLKKHLRLTKIEIIHTIQVGNFQTLRTFGDRNHNTPPYFKWKHCHGVIKVVNPSVSEEFLLQ